MTDSVNTTNTTTVRVPLVLLEDYAASGVTAVVHQVDEMFDIIPSALIFTGIILVTIFAAWALSKFVNQLATFCRCRYHIKKTIQTLITLGTLWIGTYIAFLSIGVNLGTVIFTLGVFTSAFVIASTQVLNDISAGFGLELEDVYEKHKHISLPQLNIEGRIHAHGILHVEIVPDASTENVTYFVPNSTMLSTVRKITWKDDVVRQPSTSYPSVTTRFETGPTPLVAVAACSSFTPDQREPLANINSAAALHNTSRINIPTVMTLNRRKH